MHPGKPWDWYRIGSNFILTIEYVENHPENPWNWSGISRNPRLTVEFVEKHPDKPWDWSAISRNQFSLHPRMRKRLPHVSQEQRAILEELREKFDLPPSVDERPVFRNGGIGYWEG